MNHVGNVLLAVKGPNEFTTYSIDWWKGMADLGMQKN
jgi:hypothetical protein